MREGAAGAVWLVGDCERAEVLDLGAGGGVLDEDEAGEAVAADELVTEGLGARELVEGAGEGVGGAGGEDLDGAGGTLEGASVEGEAVEGKVVLGGR